MPHVVINGAVPLGRWHAEFSPIEERRGSVVLKIGDAFLNRDGDLLLLDCLVVDRRPKGFLMMVDRRGDRTSVRLYPPTDPEKCDGVRRLIARVAYDLVHRFPECSYGRTNLAEFLEERESEEGSGPAREPSSRMRDDSGQRVPDE